jgi:peptidyl-prolyl cis-trans isomerase C
MNIQQFCRFVALTFLALAMGNTYAQSDLPKGTVAIVNGKTISTALLEQNIQTNLSQGLSDTPELRKALVDELINRELLAQDALKKDLDSDSMVKLQLEQLRKNLLAEIAFNSYLSKRPITEEQLKLEYDSQIQALGPVGNLQQYKIAQILLPSQEKANEAMLRIKKESFDKVAKELSIDASKVNGGDLGWVLPNQIIPAISNVMVNMAKGAISATAIRTQSGWHIIKLEDKRAFKVPSYIDSKERMRMSLIQKMRNDYLQELSKSAKIVR